MKWMLLLVLLISQQYVNASDFEWALREFTNAFNDQQFNRMEHFFSDSSKVGFGPGEEGYSGFIAKYGNDKLCYKKLARTLELGCKLNDSRDTCVAPPFEGEDVIGIESKASFEFTKGQLKVLYLKCSGD